WDAWLPMSLLWADTTNAPSTDALRATVRRHLLNRRINAEGYVHTQQHEGLAHSEGWPFPTWTQAGGVGWHFSVKGLPYGPELGIHRSTSTTNWTVTGGAGGSLDEARGWTIPLAQAAATVTTPAFDVDAFVAPFIRVKWSARGFTESAQPFLEWTTTAQPEFSAERRMYFAAVPGDGAIHDSDIPLHRHPEWGGRLTRLRLHFDNAPGAEATLKAVFTAVDSRHNVNNALYVQGCDDYLRWTGDLDFLRRNVQRMRLTLHWAVSEFGLRTNGWVRTEWIGHDGRSGHDLSSGQRRLLRGRGIGNNYWDLMPFGGEDALATIYHFDVLGRMARLERVIRGHPEWNIPRGPLAYDPADLERLADLLRQRGGERFWNEAAGRLGACRDLAGALHDYGYTFLNNEAICFGFTSDSQARSIRDWLDGRRVVAGDTSAGSDIYRWRFGPRATTRRNVEWYLWAWSDPASIPWGGQVQDGGAVLGFSYHDLMARLRANGPDDAWARLREVIAWFDDVQRAGGYRKYYATPERGTLQGGGTAGGLGLDHEFFESVLVPQVLMYGFLGLEPSLTGAALAPRLPKDWPALTVRGIRLHDVTLDITARNGRAEVMVTGETRRELRMVTAARPEGVPLVPGRLEIPL
ncbi:MAG: hypothetical protein ACKVYV_15760, partial [Limisphaerales bacterium]